MSRPGWQPKNDTERAMAAALRRADHLEYFRIAAAAAWYLPELVDDDRGIRAAVTRPLGGETVVPVFTSLDGLRLIVGDEADSHTQTTYQRLRAGQSNPDLWLGINYGLPIGAYLPVAAVERVVRGELTVRDGQLVAAGPDAPADPVYGPRLPVFDPHTQELLAEVEAGLSQQVVALSGTTVVVPTTRQVHHPEDLFHPESPLLVKDLPDQPTIEAFTTTEAIAAAYPHRPNVSLPFELLLILLPDRVGLSVDPGGPDELELRGPRLSLVMLSVSEQALADLPPPKPFPWQEEDRLGRLLGQVRGAASPSG